MFSSLFFAWLIHRAALGFKGVTGRILEAKPLLYLGKISYGLYLYHNFMPMVIPGVLRRLRLPYSQSAIPQFLTLVVATIVVATGSWFFFERPINNLKHRFDYAGQ